MNQYIDLQDPCAACICDLIWLLGAVDRWIPYNSTFHLAACPQSRRPRAFHTWPCWKLHRMSHRSKLFSCREPGMPGCDL